MKIKTIRLSLILAVGVIVIVSVKYSSFTKTGFIDQFLLLYPSTVINTNRPTDPFFINLAKCAEQRTTVPVVYDGSYVKINYPMGDVAPDRGVCSDVVIRSYRGMGIDLQEELHNDIKDHFASYPKLWRLMKPDTNIDHRRVPNLMVFFKRKNACLPITEYPSDYRPGDVVAWDIRAGLTHIGIVSTKTSPESGNPLIVHNMGAGPKFEDMLFRYKIIGHFRYQPSDT